MRTIRRLVAVSLTTGALAALLVTETVLRNAEDFSEGVRYGLK